MEAFTPTQIPLVCVFEKVWWRIICLAGSAPHASSPYFDEDSTDVNFGPNLARYPVVSRAIIQTARSFWLDPLIF